MSLKLIIPFTLLPVLGCAPLQEEGFGYDESSLMGVSPSGREAVSKPMNEALVGYTGVVRSGKAYIGGGYGGNGLAGQMHCQIEPDEAAWFSGCNNVTTQGFLPPGKTFESGYSGRTLWSWKESTDRIMRIVGASAQLKKNESLSKDTVNQNSVNSEGEVFEDLMSTNSEYFSSLQQGSDISSSGDRVSSFALTGESDKSQRPVYEEYSANKLATLKCQVGSKSSKYEDVVEVVLRKKTAILNAYFAKGIGYVGYKYVRAGSGGGTGTNILVCIDTQGA